MGKKILLADDSITIQKVIELTFSDEDFEVVTVGNGRLAIERVADVAPDVVLCDIIMPEKDGYEVCDFVKKNPALAHVPVLLLTGAFEPFDQDRAARVGADGYLAKPFEPQTLIAKVKEMLERGPAPRPAAPPAPEVVRHATVPVPSETAPMPAVRPTAPAAPSAPTPAAPAEFEPLYAVEEPAEFQPLEAVGGFEPLEVASFEPLEAASAESPLDSFVSEPTFAPAAAGPSATVAFIPEEPLAPPPPPAAQALPAEIELVGEPELVAEPEPEFVAEPEPELVPEPAPAVVETEFVAEPEPELVAESELLVAEAPSAPADTAGGGGNAPEPAVEAVFEAPAELSAEEPAPAFEPAPVFEPAAPVEAVEFEAPPQAVSPEPPGVAAELPLQERARAAVEAAYGAVFAADQPLAEEPPAAPSAPERESVFEFEPEPAAAEPAQVEPEPAPATEELAPEELLLPEEPVIPAEPAAAGPAAAFEEEAFEEAFEPAPAEPQPLVAPSLDTIEELTESGPEQVATPQEWAQAPEPQPVAAATPPAEEVSFEDVAPPAAPAEAPAGAPSLAAEVAVPVDMVAAIAQRVVGQISEKVIREVAWEIIPELAEALIKKEIERLRAELDRLPE